MDFFRFPEDIQLLVVQLLLPEQLKGLFTSCKGVSKLRKKYYDWLFGGQNVRELMKSIPYRHYGYGIEVLNKKWYLTYGKEYGDTLNQFLLTQAASHGYTNYFNLLLDHGVTKYGNSLRYACGSGNIDIVQILINRGCAITDYSLYYACNSSTYDIAVDRLKERNEIIRLLILKGADINTKEQYANPDAPIRFATKYEDKDLIKFLLAHGANINAGMRIASEHGSADIVKFLIEMGGVVDNYCLYACCRYGNSDVIKYFIKNTPKSKYKEFLDGVYLGNQKQSLEILADEFLPKYDPKVLHYMCESGHPELVELLIKKGFSGVVDSLPLVCGILHYNVAIAELLINNGADIHFANDESLFVATEWKHPEIVELLLNRGANIHARSDTIMITASHCAGSWYADWVIKILIGAGADIHVDDERPLRNMCYFVDNDEWDKKRCLKCIKLLLKAGADIKKVNMDNVTSMKELLTNLLLKKNIKIGKTL